MFEERKTIEDVRDAEYYGDTPLILQIFHELGDEFSGKCCKVKSKKIKKKYKDFYKFSEYEGKEEVYIDYYKYELVSTLLHDTMTCYGLCHTSVYPLTLPIYALHLCRRLMFIHMFASMHACL